MIIPIIEILSYGMTGCIISSIGCIIFNVDFKKFRNIVIIFTMTCLIKKTLEYV